MSIRFIGLTGGIASGKTTVSTHLRSLGATILCADTIYHDLVRSTHGSPSVLAKKINETFPGTLLTDGNLDRATLGQLVFGNPSQLKALGEITHPAVAAEVGERVRSLEEEGLDIVFYDVPLLYERQLQQMFEGIVVVWVPRSLQLQRLITRSSLTQDEGERRLNSQMALDEKRKQATWIIDNSGDLKTTLSQTEALWRTLKA